ncbi:MAG TPA: hypothetical protein VFZ91_08505 [Allosphingosinicella sp.]
MFQGGDESVIFWQFAFIACWILLPLVPAVLIYLIFPNTQTALGGPFSGLTLKSSGAFSAYFIVLLASYPVWTRQSEDLRALMRPTWVVEGQVKVLDEKGKEISYSNRGNSALDISLEPNLVTTRGKRFRIVVPEIDDKVPSILINYEGFGDYSIDPDRPVEGESVEIDRAKHRIVIKSPLVIRKTCQGMLCPED